MNEIAKYTAIKENTAVADNPVINMSCAACGNPNIRGYKSGGYLVISCSKCGTSYERPIVEESTDLENACDILNDYEKIRYEVKKSKEDKNDS